MSYLHVLNGDVTLTLFRQSKVPGEMVVCREMMCEGKIKHTKDPERLLESRAKHLEFHYGIDKQTYQNNVVEELEKLKDSSSFEEVILWFEYDLFCQINLLFILYYIRSKADKLPLISIVDLPHHVEASAFNLLMEKRVRLMPQDLQFADDAWDAYCMDTPQALETISKLNPGNLVHLPQAIHAHLQRFPDVHNGLSFIESYFLRKLDVGKYRWQDLYSLFWNEQKIYGFGDFQLDILVHRMEAAGVVEDENQLLKITSLGREILRNEENYLDYTVLQHRWMGGVRLENSPWRWDPGTNSIVQL
ncbi:MAG TPA: DUF1835 domain-containing protein [Chitinophaga sp.]|uniref:DUF1835 domain-containing protein n=1 Tax=Chitinophaga sp. TaxID=1869181 RepID=UPI002BA337EC|nr:DUF1835 domain-containing protein [Chitinophaga sp.]HVI46279.1 DUF1835 domain-containing protein [Chitinophaga sp.]